jgi:Zn-dependent M28 family amino/carboxypeptidase
MEKRHYPVGLASIAFVILSSVYLNSLIAVPAPREASALVADLSADRYMKHVTHLARSEMKGRGNGMPELEQAAEYIASQFRIWGLKPAGANNTYFQPFEVTTGTSFGTANQLSLNGGSLKINEDFVPIQFSTTAEAEGPVVFVGYGMTAPEMHWDDYRGIDASGKIVVAFRHEPQELDPKSLFAGTNFTSHASLMNKAINAKQHGARGIVFITDPNNHTTEPDEVGAATRNAETDDAGISAAHARRDPIMKAFQAAGKDLAAIQRKIDTDLVSQSFELPDLRIKITTDVVRARKPVRNVVAAVIGTDPVLKDEWVVAGAHYDHLGLGEKSSLAPSQIGEIHHGADDNASGTAGLLEMARLASQNRQSLKRSVLFIAFAGEELGLLGSAYFTGQPTIPLDRVQAMINLDMVGRIQNDRIFVGGVGTSPGFKAAIEDLNKSVNLNLDYSDSGYGSSDHTSFNIKRIPVLFFFSGLHSDYHKPSDTYEKINSTGAIKVMTLAYRMIDRIANSADRIQYTEVQELRPAGGGGEGSGYGAYFGSVPDFRDDLKGVLFADVRPGSPAAKSGLKVGDLLVEFDGKTIGNLYDFTYALRSRKPGDTVVVVVKRDGQDVKADVKLEARR